MRVVCSDYSQSVQVTDEVSRSLDCSVKLYSFMECLFGLCVMVTVVDSPP